MNQSDLVFFFGYNRWANAKVLTACEGLTAEQLFAPAPGSFGSLMGALAHIYGAEYNWRARLQEGLSPAGMADADDFPTLQALSDAWRVEEAKMQAYIESLTDEDVNRWVSYTTSSGKEQGSTLWRALAHLVNHGTQFRAEAAVILTQLGRSPGDLDFLQYQRQTGQR